MRLSEYTLESIRRLFRLDQTEHMHSLWFVAVESGPLRIHRQSIKANPNILGLGIGLQDILPLHQEHRVTWEVIGRYLGRGGLRIAVSTQVVGCEKS